MQNRKATLKRRFWIGSVVVLSTALVVWSTTMSNRSSQDDTRSSETPSSSTTQETSEDVTDATEVDEALVKAVYAFEAAYNMPATNERNETLKALTTPEGYLEVYRDPATMSAAEKSAGNIVIEVMTGEPQDVQVEPFEDDPNAVSVSSNLTIRVVRDGDTLRTVDLPPRVTSWIKLVNGWKMVHLQTE